MPGRCPGRRHARLPAAVSLRHQQPLAASTRRLQAQHSPSRHTHSVISPSSFSTRQEFKRTQITASLALHELRSPLDASRFLFSSVASLYVALEERVDQRELLPSRAQSCLLNVLLLLAANPDSFSSLRRLHIRRSKRADYGRRSSCPSRRWLGCRLTHLRIDLLRLSTLSCKSLVSALSSLQSLTSLNVRENAASCVELLQCLSAKAATPLLLRLRSLVLPCSDWMATTTAQPGCVRCLSVQAELAAGTACTAALDGFVRMDSRARRSPVRVLTAASHAAGPGTAVCAAVSSVPSPPVSHPSRLLSSRCHCSE